MSRVQLQAALERVGLSLPSLIVAALVRRLKHLQAGGVADQLRQQHGSQSGHMQRGFRFC